MPGQPITLTDLCGGRNGIDSPFGNDFPMNQTVESIDMDLRPGGLGEKRLGTYEYTANSSGGTAFGSGIAWVGLKDVAAPELWAYDIAGLLKRSVLGSSTWSNVTITAAPTITVLGSINATTFNNKLFWNATASDGRAHVQDTTAANTVRRVGINPGTTAPTVADQGAGAYPQTLRYYRVRFKMLNGAIVLKYSEPTPSVSWTPGVGVAAARVSRPATPANEDITHWFVEASIDNVNFYVLSADIVIATTFYDDSALVATYGNGALSYPLGYFTLPPNFLATVTDGNRLIGIFGSAVYWTPVLGTLNLGDDERIVQTSTRTPYLSLNEKDGGDLTGLARTVNGAIYVFKARQTWRLVPTGNDVTPYVARKISDVSGAINPNCVTAGETSTGAPCVYVLHVGGVHQIAADGIHYCTRDVDDLLKLPNKGWISDINATASYPGHLVYSKSAGILMLWVSRKSTAANSPELFLVMFVKRALHNDQWGIRGGWSRWMGPTAGLASGTLADSLSAVSAPNLDNLGDDAIWSGAFTSSKIYQLLSPTAVAQDNGVNFQAYFKTRHVLPSPNLQTEWAAGETILTGTNITGTGTIRLTITRDQAAETRAFDVTLDSGNFWKFEDADMQGAGMIQYQVGDSAAANARWRFQALTINLFAHGIR